MWMVADLSRRFNPPALAGIDALSWLKWRTAVGAGCILEAWCDPGRAIRGVAIAADLLAYDWPNGFDGGVANGAFA